MLKSMALNSSFRIIPIDHTIKLETDIQHKINEIWEQESLTRKLFNDNITSVKSSENNSILVYSTQYKYFLAQLKFPELYEILNIRPLAASGLLECKDGVVFGKRNKYTSQGSNQIELVPSGGLNDKLFDYKQQILSELDEECGINEIDVNYIEPFLLVEDLVDHVFDIGVYLHTSLKSSNITQCFHACASDEYSDLKIIDKTDLNAFLSENMVLPISIELLKYFYR